MASPCSSESQARRIRRRSRGDRARSRGGRPRLRRCRIRRGPTTQVPRVGLAGAAQVDRRGLDENGHGVALGLEQSLAHVAEVTLRPPGAAAGGHSEPRSGRDRGRTGRLMRAASPRAARMRVKRSAEESVVALGAAKSRPSSKRARGRNRNGSRPAYVNTASFETTMVAARPYPTTSIRARSRRADAPPPLARTRDRSSGAPAGCGLRSPSPSPRRSRRRCRREREPPSVDAARRDPPRPGADGTREHVRAARRDDRARPRVVDR